MGLAIDFLDVGVYGPVDRLEDRPKNSNQPNPAKADLFRSEVSRVRSQLQNRMRGFPSWVSHSLSNTFLALAFMKTAFIGRTTAHLTA
jgi:hypothetical protein